jgi:hypothetical protein
LLQGLVYYNYYLLQQFWAITVAVSLLQAVALAVAIQRILAWFNDLDAGTQEAVTDHFLEDPSSLTKVNFFGT